MTPLFSQLSKRIRPIAQALSAQVKPLERSASFGSFVFSKTPKKVQQWMLEPALNHALQVLVDNGELDFLDDKTCGIAVKDTDQCWVLGIVDGQLKLLDQPHADVTISATIPAFMKLVSQQADPDALFFERQLSIEGDVELGLHVKNMLDSLDEDDLPIFWRTTLTHLRTLLSFEGQAR
jgi:predicted lipid carrier protein YhbT